MSASLTVRAEQLTSSTVFASAGPGTPAGRLLRQFWQPVHLSADLAVGRAKPITIMGEKFTLFRGESGSPHVVAHRCAHRSTQLSVGWVRGDSIQCLYHGWTFDGTGKCVDRPGEAPAGPAPHISVAAYPTREHLGLIYTYFGPGEAPAFPPFPSFENAEPEAVSEIENFAIDMPCNWFQTYENGIDEVHVAFVHSGGGSHKALGRGITLPDIAVHETAYGLVRKSRSGSGTMRDTLYLFPNTMRIFIPPSKGQYDVAGWRDAYITFVPTDDGSHIMFKSQHVSLAPEQREAYRASWAVFQARMAAAPPPRAVARDILDGRYTLQDIPDHPLLLIIEDCVAQQGQGEIVDRNQEILGRTDVGIVQMRRVFQRELDALTSGAPTKRWSYNGELPTRGF